jgi:hypothetical protein
VLGAIGIVTGVAGALASNRVLRTLAFGTSRKHPFVFVVVAELHLGEWTNVLSTQAVKPDATPRDMTGFSLVRWTR